MNNRKYLAGVGVFLLTVLMMMELPYSDHSIVELILPPIKFKTDGAVTSVLFLSGILSVIGFLYSYILVVKSKKFHTNGFIVFLVMFAVMLPIAQKGLEFVKAPIYYFANGVKSIELLESSIYLVPEDNGKFIAVKLELKGYKDSVSNYRVGIRLNESLNSNGLVHYYELSKKISLHPGVNTVIDQFKVGYDFGSGFDNDRILGSIMRNETYEIILMDDTTESVFVRTDIDN